MAHRPAVRRTDAQHQLCPGQLQIRKLLGGRRGKRRHGKVQLSLLQKFFRVQRAALRNRECDFRMLALERLIELREKDRAGHRRDADPETVFLFPEILHLPGQLVELADELLRAFAQKAPFSGQNQPPALVAEKIYLKFALQLPDGPRD